MSLVEKYREAGSIAFQSLKYARDIAREGMKVMDLCEEVENKIRKLNGNPAFPCNVSQNSEAAHYSAGLDDEKKVEAGSVLKIDIGVHVEGCIADTATTVTFSSNDERMAMLNLQLLEDAIKSVKAGASVGVVADAVEQKAQRSGYRPIANLAGHQLDVYVIHAGVSVPNVKERVYASFKEDTAYAIEPFLVPHEARGWVINSNGGNIYRLLSRKRTKDSSIDQLVDYIWEKFKSLPFSPRWLLKDFRKDILPRLMNEMIKKRLIMQYPVLVEASGAKVTQFEHTIFILSDGVIVTTAGS
ncbi:MAG: type II methionyl aminopeptidase [Conexivisphaerales archaeon]